MRPWSAYIGLLSSAIFWGASFVATKYVLVELSPATITVARFGLGLVVLFLMIGHKRARKAFRRELAASALILGFLGITFHQWLQANGLKTAQATVGSWIVATIPIFVAILGRLFLQERLRFLQTTGIGIASVGALVVIGQGDPLSIFNGKVGTIGDFLFAVSSLNWAVFTVLSRGIMTTVKDGEMAESEGFNDERIRVVEDPLGFMFVVMTYGWLLSLVWLLVDGGALDLLRMGSGTTLSILFLGVASSGLAYAFWYGGLGQIQAAQAGVFLYIEPYVTAALAWPILGERMTLAVLLGGGAIIIGVWLVNRGGRARRGRGEDP